MLQRKKPNKKGKRQIIPLGFVLKYEPPIIGLTLTVGLLYKESLASKHRKVYNIHLQNLINLEDEVEITTLLFDEHPEFLDPAVIEPEQVLGLVQKLMDFKTERQIDQSEAFIQSDEETDSHIIDDMESIIN